MRLLARWLLAASLQCAAILAHADEMPGRVVLVIDGDTVLGLLRCADSAPGAGHGHALAGCASKRPFKIRLADIDAPEKDQLGGAESARSLAALVLKKRVTVMVRAVDKYGRLVAHLVQGGTSVNEEQVRRGMAWEYSSYHSNKAYIALQQEARQAGRGVWATPNPMPPWEWRKLHPAGAPDALPHADEGRVCGSKRYCSQMRSCDEARFYLTECGMASLDGNNDGVPCENLCSAK